MEQSTLFSFLLVWYNHEKCIEGGGVMAEKNWEYGKPGRRSGQKFKSLLVIQYILKHADDETPVSMMAIQKHLDKYGIDADRHSIYRDIYDFLDLLNAEQNEGNEIEARDRLNYEITFTRKPHKEAPHGGYLVTARPYKYTELRLLAECVNAARFLSENQARNLRRTISGLCSARQAKELNTESTVVNRSKTANQSVMDSISTINKAIRNGHQIRFKYLSYSFNNLRTQVERRGGKYFVAHPYKLLIDNGFFYVLTYDGNRKKKKTIPYRIDRMKEVKELPLVREWDDEFAANVNMENYTRRVFSMFSGERETVTIRFHDFKLDTVVDQFGIKGVKYEKVDDTHFTARAEVETSDMFYAWVCGFGRRAKIIDPPHVVEEMREFVKKVSDMYEPR